MKIMILFLLNLLLLVILTSCDKMSKNNPNMTSSKLFNEWVLKNQDLSVELDFRNSSFGYDTSLFITLIKNGNRVKCKNNASIFPKNDNTDKIFLLIKLGKIIEGTTSVDDFCEGFAGYAEINVTNNTLTKNELNSIKFINITSYEEYEKNKNNFPPKKGGNGSDRILIFNIKQ